MLPDPNALLGTIPGADVLNSLLGNTPLSGVFGTVTGPSAIRRAWSS